ncbi:hypothetical protein N7488_006801 [Penicillium malachiteum]|nr:hypothetical protein N7488_006801 [Penicillium malachiteum]
MEPTHSWFTQEPIQDKYVQNAIISTQEPVPRAWRIARVVIEHDKQTTREFDEQGFFSFATIRLACRRAEIRVARSPSPDTEIRVYLQVPYINTELEDPDVRAEQAVDFEPKELKAYKMMTPDESVFQFTPNLLGILLEYGVDSQKGGFWKLEKYKRDIIRIHFENQFMEMIRLGIFPKATDANNLLFDKSSGRL